MSPSLSIELPAKATSPRAARQAVAAHLDGWSRAPELLLCVSEVVTNAVLHAHSAVRLAMTDVGSRVRVEVYDDDPTLPVRRHPQPATPTGRGLLLLDGVSPEWGAAPSGSGKVVWFTFDLEGSA